jgi:hypothetical protein
MAMLFLVVGLTIPAVANAAKRAKSGNNAGDVWVDNVGQPPGPGHEMNAHLACADINLWGNGLSGTSGGYTVDGWSPSGSHQQAYASTWSYDTSKGGDQITDVIDVQKLVANATANGDTPKNKQGLHLKLQFVQTPQKYKTFWVNCPASTPQPPPGHVGLQQRLRARAGPREEHQQHDRDHHGVQERHADRHVHGGRS